MRNCINYAKLKCEIKEHIYKYFYFFNFYKRIRNTIQSIQYTIKQHNTIQYKTIKINMIQHNSKTKKLRHSVRNQTLEKEKQDRDKIRKYPECPELKGKCPRPRWHCHAEPQPRCAASEKRLIWVHPRSPQCADQARE